MFSVQNKRVLKALRYRTHAVNGNSPTTSVYVPSYRSLFLKVGGEEVEYDPGFQLYLQTKLSNPHYKPEIAAQV